MSGNGPLGCYSICLQTRHLGETAAFYRDLGFEPTGEDAPGQHISLANGEDVLTFMDVPRESDELPRYAYPPAENSDSRLRAS